MTGFTGFYAVYLIFRIHQNDVQSGFAPTWQAARTYMTVWTLVMTCAAVVVDVHLE